MNNWKKKKKNSRICVCDPSIRNKSVQKKNEYCQSVPIVQFFFFFLNKSFLPNVDDAEDEKKTCILD